jgi:hypothetical protein
MNKASLGNIFKLEKLNKTHECNGGNMSVICHVLP